MVLSIILLVVLVIGALAFIGAPLFRGRAIHRSDEERRAALLERDITFQLLRDLNHDRATGKVLPEDYEEQKTQIEARAIAALARLDALGVAQDGDPLEGMVRTERMRLVKEKSR